MSDNADRVFDIGSVAKVLTPTLLAQHVIEGALALDDDIASHLGINLNNNAKISFKQLANHTSGLPRLPPGLLWQSLFNNSDNPYKQYDDAKLLNYLQNQLKQKKTHKSRYSNLGFGVLGHTLAHINQCSFETLLQQKLCTPLELDSTSTDRTKLAQKLVIGQDKKGKPVPFWDLASLTGAGGIYSSANDLAKLLIANFDLANEAIALQQRPTHKLNKQVSIALGWLVISDPSNLTQPFYWHNGGTSGFSSQMLMDVTNRTGLILLSNISSMYLLKGRALEKLAFELFKTTRMAKGCVSQPSQT